VNDDEPAHLFPDSDTLIPRFREAGEVTLDLHHRDGRVEDRWLQFHPREFELLWRLAEQPGRRVTGKRSFGDRSPARVDPETGSLAVHVSRIRAKLALFGLARMIAEHSGGGYFLDAAAVPRAFGLSAARSA